MEATQTTHDRRQLLIDALAQKRGLAPWSALARDLGVPKQSLIAAVNGTRPFGVVLLRAIRQNYPDLRDVLDTFLYDHDPAA